MSPPSAALVKLFEKPAFRWKEPQAFILAKNAMEEKRDRWWHNAVLALVYMLMLLGTWALAQLNPTKHPPPFEVVIWIAAGGSLVFAYGLPWLTKVFHVPSDVRMCRRTMLRQDWGTILWDYSKMRCFDWVLGPEYHVLMLKYGERERVVSLDVPTDMDTEAMSAFLVSKGVPRAPAVA